METSDGNVAGTELHIGDFVVITAYFAIVLFVGLWTSRKNRGSAGGYFLAGRNMHFILVGCSLFASNIGSIHFVGLAGSGAASGIAIGLYELNAMYILLMLGYLFLPVYVASGVYTMPEYLKCRFGGQRIQVYIAVLALLVYIFTKISADLYAGAIFIEQSMKWDIYWSIMLLLGIAAIFTITGGLTAVIWTDFIQTIIMIIGAVALMVISFSKVGGFQGMIEKYPHAIPNTTLYTNNSNTTTCGKPRQDYMHLFRDAATGDLPWPGLLGLSINSVWYWCSDQVIVQRALAGKSFDHAKAGTIFCGYLKILPLFLFIFPGMIARILFPNTVGCADPEECMRICGSDTGCSNIAYPSLVINLLPPGARGMMLAVMMAGLMSSLTSIFNSSSTIFALDIWTRIRKKASEMEVMIVGRLFVVILVVISIIWIPVIRMSEGSQLFVYFQEVSSFTQPPICCIFILGLFWSRLNEKGAFFGLVIGMVTGLARFVVEYSYGSPKCGDTGPDPRPAIIKDFHYLYFSVFLFVLTGTCAIVISLLTRPFPEKCLHRLTFWTRHSKEERTDIDDWEKDENVKNAKKTSNGDLELDGYENSMETDKLKDRNDEEKVLEPANQNIDDWEKDENVKNAKKTSNGDLELDGYENSMDTDKLKDHDDEEEVIEPANQSLTVRRVPRLVFNWVCGLDNNNRSMSQQVQKEDMLSIDEKPKWKIISIVLSVSLMVILLAHFIYFA